MALPWRIRPIEPRDDAAIASVIRTVMPECGAIGEGLALNDAQIDWMYRAYSRPRSVYFVVEVEGRVLGGSGIAALADNDGDICELRKMYLLRQMRGQGAGKALLQRCLEAARSFGYRQCYLETWHTMNDAIRLYERSGFRRVGAPRRTSEGAGFDTFYLLQLQPPPARDNTWDAVPAA